MHIIKLSLTFTQKNRISQYTSSDQRRKERNPMSEINIDLTLTFNIPYEGLNVNGLLFGLKIGTNPGNSSFKSTNQVTIKVNRFRVQGSELLILRSSYFLR